MSGTKTFPIWKIVETGAYASAGALSGAVEGAGHVVYASDTFDSPDFAIDRWPGPTRLALVTVKDLGMVEGSKVANIISQGHRLGLSACPPETAALLRLVWTDQEEGSWVTVVSKPLRVASACGGVCETHCPQKEMLFTLGADSHGRGVLSEKELIYGEVVWDTDTAFVFAL